MGIIQGLLFIGIQAVDARVHTLGFRLWGLLDLQSSEINGESRMTSTLTP